MRDAVRYDVASVGGVPHAPLPSLLFVYVNSKMNIWKLRIIYKTQSGCISPQIKAEPLKGPIVHVVCRVNTVVGKYKEI